MTKERVCANGFVMPTSISRRNFIRVLPATGVALGFAEPVHASEEQLLSLYREWRTARKEWLQLSELGCDGTPEIRAAEEREDNAFRKAADITPSSSAGIAALAHMLWDVCGPQCAAWTADHKKELDIPEIKLIAAIWRASAKKNSLPPSP